MYETYSERKHRLEKAGQPDVYTYDRIPEKLRNQIIHIWNRTLGDGHSDQSFRIYAKIERQRVCSIWPNTKAVPRPAASGFKIARPTNS
jgi:hypothetical protein